MSKNSHFTGQPVYSQVLKLLDKEKILQISRETKGSEAYVKRFDGYKHLVVMLFGILKHFDSLRELEIGMKAEAHKLVHLGMDYLVRRSTLAEANIRRPQEFFARVYAYLLEKYAKFLADSRPPKSYKGQTHEPKDWEKLLYMMDSTTITLFDNILKGVGRHPKSGKKKGGMKVHTVMKYLVGVPMVVQLTSAAKHDHYLLKEVHLPKDSTLAMDRGYKPKGRFFWFTFGICMVRIRYADQKLLCLQWKCGLGLEMALSVDARRGSAPCRWAFPGVLFIIKKCWNEILVILKKK